MADKRYTQPAQPLPENMIEGRNALTEALKSGRTIDKVYVADGDTDKALVRLAAQAKQAGAVIVKTDRRKLDQLSPTGAHQGVIASVAAHDYCSVQDILSSATSCPTPTIWGRSCARQSVPAPTASSFPGAEAWD